MRVSSHRTHVLKAAQGQALATTNLGAHAGAVAAMSGGRYGAGVMQGFGPTQITDEVRQGLIDQGMMTGGAFSPGTPISQFFPADAPPRKWDLPTGFNVASRPRAGTGRVSYYTLKSIIEAWDVARLCINHHQRDIRSFAWDILPAEGVEEDVSSDIEAARKFWSKPDGYTPFDAWQQLLMEDVLRFDAGTIYRERTRAGKLGALQVVSGITIAPLIDYWGRVPAPPAPSHVQYVQGIPSVWLNRDQVIYQPFQPLPEDPYGLPVIEWLLLTGNTDLRFQWHFLNWFTEGSVPDGFMEAPPDMSDPEAIKKFQAVWDAVMEGDQAMKHKIRWVPAGSKPIFPAEKKFDPQFPLYLLRKVCAGFGITPNDIGITDAVNKASSETQMDVQFRIGTQPLLNYFQGIYTRIEQEDFGRRTRFVFDTGREKEDRLDEARAWQIWINSGVASPDEPRQNVLGLPVDVANPAPRFVNNNRLGAIPLKSIAEIAGTIDPTTMAPDGPVEQIDAKGLLAPQAPQSDLKPSAHPPASKPGKSGEEVAGDEGEEAATPGGEQETEPTPNEVKKELARWRKNAIGRVRKGQRPREFDSDILDGATAATVWSALHKARSVEEVEGAFKLPLRKAESKGVIVGGLAVKASDTGRVLMLQRSNEDDTDPARGTWEFPGGHVEDGEEPLEAAKREWAEETGAKLPQGEVAATWLSPNGIYQGFVYVVPDEASVDINLDGENSHRVLNPDDPDGDHIEVAAWWDLDHIMGNPALRPEAHTTDWNAIRDAGLPLQKALDRGLNRLLDRAATHHAAQVANALKAGVDTQKVARDGSVKGVKAPDLELVLRGIYADGWRIGQGRAEEQLGQAVKKALTVEGIPADQWEPGNPAAADQLDQGGFQALLDQSGITIKGIDQTTRDRMGTVLAEGASSGASVDDIASELDDLLEDPGRAWLIADTELNRAVSAATLATYGLNGIDQWDWLAEPDACIICADLMENGPYILTDDAPPQHPGCRCSAAPHLTGED